MAPPGCPMVLAGRVLRSRPEPNRRVRRWRGRPPPDARVGPRHTAPYEIPKGCKGGGEPVQADGGRDAAAARRARDHALEKVAESPSCRSHPGRRRRCTANDQPMCGTGHDHPARAGLPGRTSSTRQRGLHTAPASPDRPGRGGFSDPRITSGQFPRPRSATLCGQRPGPDRHGCSAESGAPVRPASPVRRCRR
jgi:hypothetical protein